MYQGTDQVNIDENLKNSLSLDEMDKIYKDHIDYLNSCLKKEKVESKKEIWKDEIVNLSGFNFFPAYVRINAMSDLEIEEIKKQQDQFKDKTLEEVKQTLISEGIGQLAVAFNYEAVYNKDNENAFDSLLRTVSEQDESYIEKFAGNLADYKRACNNLTELPRKFREEVGSFFPDIKEKLIGDPDQVMTQVEEYETAFNNARDSFFTIDGGRVERYMLFMSHYSKEVGMDNLNYLSSLFEQKKKLSEKFFQTKKTKSKINELNKKIDEKLNIMQKEVEDKLCAVMGIDKGKFIKNGELDRKAIDNYILEKSNKISRSKDQVSRSNKVSYDYMIKKAEETKQNKKEELGCKQIDIPLNQITDDRLYNIKVVKNAAIMGDMVSFVKDLKNVANRLANARTAELSASMVAANEEEISQGRGR